MIRPSSAALVGFLLIATGAPTAQAPPPAPAVPAAAADGVPARHAEEGRPFVRVYLPEEVSGAGQNWGMVQDARGVIYVARPVGVIEFDGVAWRLDRNAEGLGIVRSLAIDAHGRIYAAGSGDFGYLEPDANGQLAYRSRCSHSAGRRPGSSPTSGGCSSRVGVLFHSEQLTCSAGPTTPPGVPGADVGFNRGSLVDGRVLH